MSASASVSVRKSPAAMSRIDLLSAPKHGALSSGIGDQTVAAPVTENWQITQLGVVSVSVSVTAHSSRGNLGGGK